MKNKEFLSKLKSYFKKSDSSLLSSSLNTLTDASIVDNKITLYISSNYALDILKGNIEDIKKIYQLLNHDRLYGKIKFIPTPEGEDPSSVFQKFGKKGVIECLKNAKQIEEIYLG